MTEERDIFQTDSSPRWVGLAIIGLAVIALAGMGLAWNATSHIAGAEKAMTAQGKTFQQNADSLNQRLAQEEQENAEIQSELNLVGDKLKLTEGELTAARTQVKQSRADYTKELAQIQSTVDDQLSTKANNDDVKALGSDVDGVKNGLDSTKNDLSLLRNEHGELIAHNHEEIDQLRRLGERDIWEFTLSKKGEKQHVGTMQIELRGASAKKHQFSVALYVDDQRLDKKNRALDEPIYFYTTGSRAPLELVVNQVSNNKISGYLSVPKNISTSSASASTTSGS